uniref:Protein rogdi n=1 Tax=Panagrolaimus sp. JU765 TaxID=591449 RepID=A0AC34RJ18_9BILA
MNSENNLSMKEAQWLEASSAREVFHDLENLLRDICDRLKVSTKVENHDASAPKVTQPEKFILVSKNNQDSLKATVTLFDENIIQSEISLKYPKIPGGIYRSVANPNVQWKIQQLQDTGNQCARALQIVLKGKQRYDRCIKTSGYDGQSLLILLSVLRGVKDLVGDARTCLTMPRKKSLLELCQFQPTKSFNPPLPHDILLSYYISASKLVCAAYQVVTMKQNGAQSVTVYQAEAHLPHLVDVLQHLNTVFSRVQDLLTKFGVLKIPVEVL